MTGGKLDWADFDEMSDEEYEARLEAGEAPPYEDHGVTFPLLEEYARRRLEARREREPMDTGWSQEALFEGAS